MLPRDQRGTNPLFDALRKLLSQPGQGGGSSIADPTSFLLDNPKTQRDLQAPTQQHRPPPNQTMSPYDMLLSQIGTGTTFDYQSALADSESAIRKAYHGEIGAIKGNNRAARRQTAGDRQELEQMYNALSQSYRKAGRQEMRQGKQLSRQEQNTATRSANRVEKRGKRIIGQQTSLAKDLGITDAVAGNVKRQTNKTEKMTKQIESQGAKDANRQLGYAGTSRRFMNRGGQSSKLEGTNRSADLITNLQDYIRANRGVIAGLKGKRGQDILAGQASVGAAEASAKNDLWGQLMDATGMGLKIDTANTQNALDAAKFRQSSKYDMAKLRQDSQSKQTNPSPAWMQNVDTLLSGSSNPRQLSSLFDNITQGNVSFSTGQFTNPGNNQNYPLTASEAGNIMVAQALKKNPNLSPRDLAILRRAAMVFAQGN